MTFGPTTPPPTPKEWCITFEASLILAKQYLAKIEHL